MAARPVRSYCTARGPSLNFDQIIAIALRCDGYNIFVLRRRFSEYFSLRGASVNSIANGRTHTNHSITPK